MFGSVYHISAVFSIVFGEKMALLERGKLRVRSVPGVGNESLRKVRVLEGKSTHFEDVYTKTFQFLSEKYTLTDARRCSRLNRRLKSMLEAGS
jgi:hypothetical protein